MIISSFSKFFKSELFSCLKKVDHVINECKRPIFVWERARTRGGRTWRFDRNCATLNLFLTVPSQPVGPEANYINSSALLVKWQPPLYPNGIITNYIVKYDLSDYSPWKQDLNWCNRQILTGAESNVGDEEDDDKNPDGKTSQRIIESDVF